MADWSIEDSKKLYGLKDLREEYLEIGGDGYLYLKLGKHRINIYDLLVENNLSGAYIRIPKLIRDQMNRVVDVFNKAYRRYKYKGGFKPVYPLKTNSNPLVIDTIYNYERHRWGFNINTYPEIKIVEKYLDKEPRMIVVDGVKNKAMLEKLERFREKEWFIVIDIEGWRDIELLNSYRDFKTGLKIKYLTRGKGPWKESSGIESKFGLSINLLLEIISKHDWVLENTVLLHMHPGSQIYDLGLMKKYFTEAVNMYNELRNNGFNKLEYLDLGGGLPYPYNPDKLGSLYSPNYGLKEYVEYLVKTIVSKTNIHPHIVFENGRYLTASHRIVVSKILETRPLETIRRSNIYSDKYLLDINDLDKLEEIMGIIDSEKEIDVQRYSLDTRSRIEEKHMYYQGIVVEKIYRYIVEKKIDPISFWKKYRRLRKYIVKPTYRYYTAFSIFTHIPDKAIVNQYFQPIPIQMLDKKPDVLAILSDLTCDSMGEYGDFISYLENSIDYEKLFTKIDHKLMWMPGKPLYLKAIPLHLVKSDQEYYVALLDTGAYQDNLSMKHNSLEGYPEIIIDIKNNQLYIEIIGNENYSY